MEIKRMILTVVSATVLYASQAKEDKRSSR